MELILVGNEREIAVNSQQDIFEKMLSREFQRIFLVLVTWKFNSHQSPSNYTRPSVCEELEVEVLPKSRIELDAHIEVV